MQLSSLGHFPSHRPGPRPFEHIPVTVWSLVSDRPAPPPSPPVRCHVTFGTLSSAGGGSEALRAAAGVGPEFNVPPSPASTHTDTWPCRSAASQGQVSHSQRENVHLFRRPASGEKNGEIFIVQEPGEMMSRDIPFGGMGRYVMSRYLRHITSTIKLYSPQVLGERMLNILGIGI